MTSTLTPPSPQHVAIIMDGNGRWAKSRGLPRTAGHKQGVEATKRVVKAAGELGIPYLTLFGFSSENWSRPRDEVQELMRLLRVYLRAETASLHENNIRLRVIGDRSALDHDIVELMEAAEKLTGNNSGLNLTIALNYGGRQEVLAAAYSAMQEYLKSGHQPNLAEFAENFPRHLMTHGLPDPDIMIRTSGEQRTSNFLLWQCAYTELVFTQTLWPDFGRADLEAAMTDYAGRDRRFGAISA
jgi:undecaprenyl diphosphate synthase